jgi:glycosyltransferase involved in cell wall biosynthesis
LKILVIGKFLDSSKLTGVERSAIEGTNALAALQHNVCVLGNKDSKFIKFLDPAISVIHQPKSSNIISEIWKFSQNAKRLKADVIINFHSFPLLTKTKQFVCVHDLAFFFYRKMFTKNQILKLVTMHAALSFWPRVKVFCPSKQTQMDWAKVFPHARNRAYYLPWGIDHLASPQEYEKKNSTSDYLLTIGTIQPRKNYKLLIDLAKQLGDVKIKIVGKPGWLSDNIVNDLTAVDNIYLLSSIDDNMLVNLIDNSIGGIFTSLYEGFCFPVYEMNLRGKICLIPDNSAFKDCPKVNIVYRTNNLDSLVSAVSSLRKSSNRTKVFPSELSMLGWKNFAVNLQALFIK